MGDNTKYSLNAPLSPSGVDVVDDFLFHTPPRLVRADREQPRHPGPQRRHPGPARHGLRARYPRRPDRAVRRPRERRARVGRDLLPGHRMAGLRPDGLRPARRRRQAGRFVVVRRPPQRGTASRHPGRVARARRRGRDAPRSSPTGAAAAPGGPRGARPRCTAWNGSGARRAGRGHRRKRRASTRRALAERLGDDRLRRGRRDPRRGELYSADGAPESDRAERRRGANLALTVKGIL